MAVQADIEVTSAITQKHSFFLYSYLASSQDAMDEDDIGDTLRDGVNTLVQYNMMRVVRLPDSNYDATIDSLYNSCLIRVCRALKQFVPLIFDGPPYTDTPEQSNNSNSLFSLML